MTKPHQVIIESHLSAHMKRKLPFELLTTQHSLRNKSVLILSFMGKFCVTVCTDKIRGINDAGGGKERRDEVEEDEKITSTTADSTFILLSLGTHSSWCFGNHGRTRRERSGDQRSFAQR
jgi:hypothetical protein